MPKPSIVARSSRICTWKCRRQHFLVSKFQFSGLYSFRDLSIYTDIRTDGHGSIDLASHPDHEDIYFRVRNASFYQVTTFQRI